MCACLFACPKDDLGDLASFSVKKCHLIRFSAGGGMLAAVGRRWALRLCVVVVCVFACVHVHVFACMHVYAAHMDVHLRICVWLQSSSVHTSKRLC